MFWRCPEDRLWANGEGLLPTFSQVRHLSGSTRLHIRIGEDVKKTDTKDIAFVKVGLWNWAKFWTIWEKLWCVFASPGTTGVDQKHHFQHIHALFLSWRSHALGAHGHILLRYRGEVSSVVKTVTRVCPKPAGIMENDGLWPKMVTVVHESTAATVIAVVKQKTSQSSHG